MAGYTLSFSDAIGQAFENYVLAKIKLTGDNGEPTAHEKAGSYLREAQQLKNYAKSLLPARDKGKALLEIALVKGSDEAAAQLSATFSKNMISELQKLGGNKPMGDIQIGDVAIELKFYQKSTVTYFSPSDVSLPVGSESFFSWLEDTPGHDNPYWNQRNDSKWIPKRQDWSNIIVEEAFDQYVKALQPDAKAFFNYIMHKGNLDAGLNKHIVRSVRTSKKVVVVEIDMDAVNEFIMAGNISYRDTKARTTAFILSDEGMKKMIMNITPNTADIRKGLTPQDKDNPEGPITGGNVGMDIALTSGYFNYAMQKLRMRPTSIGL